ncbi:50S ribosomal protein L5 [Candidatus Shapirobacteria bacterium RIFOXYD1_FULL_38_32]|uniref:Large ribosomal subunit protein uL5 n=3 Tax=Candidatus Shapironibacteriota TaxID=1752721 RepID=A0A0G0M8R9_9BACT|nr:MAG: 50S ribosomal protein L5 [Candidatus Shapirobacteria bacterium GW2011_GWE2_38_30]KKQ91433.1 MAG: 50S ribosomal protein L5 [Candidatus Shapirobacteria bacterium GW2011_GWE1_38_92]OGL55872.1 MAG: 50S ribosomal protein L5 [Candidatus Shapirobacteria bacterium RIFOXYA1_FULL_39_17]OGL57119.1 MAG: 50S ribosomal protein L5 [Candidatus Shapirobacteria bacterium RIFOXYD1_FULL_38_32]OGL57456.1 MAG: 50S ribosomal protein L5 [Candidatus Shapirobacteria bacterium RIFOXYB1_FULL_38_38]HCU55466.1 50S 
MLQETISTTIKEKLIKLTGRKQVLSLPRLSKVVLNYRVPDARDSQESLNSAIEELTAIAGQKPSLTKSKKSIANFKLRQGDPLALKVTLRGKRMYGFVEKLFSIVLPRLRDFKGLSLSSFDNSGNYNLTLKDQTYFPEIDLDKVSKIRSLQVTLGITTSSKDEAKMLLSALGLPFEKEDK